MRLSSARNQHQYGLPLYSNNRISLLVTTRQCCRQPHQLYKQVANIEGQCASNSLHFIVGYLIQARKVALFAFIINVACLGNAPRGYCESIGNTAGATGPGSEVDYSGQRPLSPQHILQQQQQQQQQQRNGFPFPNRGSFPSPSTPSNNGGAPGGGSENFHSFHADKLPHSLAEANTFPSIQQVCIFLVYKQFY